MLQLSVRPTIDAHVRAAWQEQVAVAVKTPGLAPALLQRRQALLPRFAAYYTRLRALPRRVRRVLQRKWKLSLAGMALLLALGQEPALAATINVSGGCSLINAITAANTDTATGGCPQGSGADTITLPAGSIQTLTTVNNSTYGPTGLPVVSSVITIEGNDSTIQRESSDPDLFRILAINGTGNLTLKNTTISGGVVSGGDFFPSNNGGGILNYNGVVTLEGSTVSGNTASTGGGMANIALNSGRIMMTLRNSTVSGNTAGDGGGIDNRIYSSTGTSVVTLSNSIVSGNTAGNDGGGIANRAPYSDVTVTLSNSTVSGNTAGRMGGGVVNRYNSGLTLTNSTVSGNTAGGAGGGVANFSQEHGFAGVTLSNSTVSGNTAGGAGGGVANIADYYGASSGVTLSNSIISGNTAGDDGGGIANFVGYFLGGGLAVANLSNSTVSGNTAGGNGGGVFNDASEIGGDSSAGVILSDSTVSGNIAGSNGGGVFNNRYYVGGGGIGSVLTLTHSLLSGNTASASGAEVYNYASANYTGAVVADNFNLFGHSGLNNTQAFSGFSPSSNDINATSNGINTPLGSILNPTLADNGGPTETHALVPGSPAIDAVASGCPPPDTDQRGFLRPAEGDSIPGALCDIGAFEFNTASAALEVSLDIKPGASPSTINPKSNGVIPVAILSTADFNAATVDPLSVEFGPQGALEAHGKGHIEDVNGDGKKDLVLHFRTQDTGIVCGATSVSLTGETVNGDLIQGSDTIKTVGCKKP